MGAAIAILVLALTISLVQAAPIKQRPKANAEKSRHAKPAQRCGSSCCSLILGIGY